MLMRFLWDRHNKVKWFRLFARFTTLYLFSTGCYFC